MDYLISKDDLLNSWGEFITESKSPAVMDEHPWAENRKYLMATLAHNKSYVLENFDPATGSNTNGAGPVQLPADPGSYADFSDPTRQLGSGDPAIAVLGLGMSIAAHTIAFDLFPTVPIHSELVLVEYVDTIYAGGRFDTEAKPEFIKLTDNTISGLALEESDLILIHGADDAAAAQFVFVQRDRISKAILVKVQATGTFTIAGGFVADTSISLDDVSAAAASYQRNGSASAAIAGDFTLAFANPNDQHIQAFSAYGNLDGEPVDRRTAEQGTQSEMELVTYTKAIQAKSYTVTGKVSRQQHRQFKSKGLDAVPILKRAMQNEVTQSINDDLIERARKLGVTNHANLLAAQGVNLNLFIGPASTADKAFTTFSIRPFVDARGVNRSVEFGAIVNSETNSAAENLYSRQARLRSRILLASAVIGNVSRFGSADAVVVGTQLLAALKESKGFQGSQISNTLTNSTKALYFAGTIADVKIYCNPKWNYNDFTVMVMRTNKTIDGSDKDNLNQGIVFLPYDLAADVDIIAEGNFSPKFLVESVYAIAETGIHPEMAYLTFGVANDFGSWA